MKRIIYVFFVLISCSENFFQKEAVYDGMVLYVNDLSVWNKIKDKSADEIVDSLGLLSGRSISDFSSVSIGLSDSEYQNIYESTMKKYPDIYRLDDNDLILVSEIFPIVRTKEDVLTHFDIIESILIKVITYDFCMSQMESRITNRGSSGYFSEKQKDLMNRNIKYVEVL